MAQAYPSHSKVWEQSWCKYQEPGIHSQLWALQLKKTETRDPALDSKEKIGSNNTGK